MSTRRARGRLRRRLHAGLPGGLRVRLTVLIALLVALSLGAGFAATYNRIGREVRKQIESDLKQDAATFDTQAIGATATKPSIVARQARHYVGLQPGFGASARLYAISVEGASGPPITNEPDLLIDTPGASADERLRHRRNLAALRRAPVGFSTVTLSRAGSVRLRMLPIVRQGRTVALAGVGEPLASVARARSSVAQTFVVSGLLVLVLTLTVGWLVASRTSLPLRRMARMVAEVDAGDLEPRLRAHGPNDEVQVLADAFDRMLDRLEDAFARQRTFVSDASHELRTPLTVIRGQLEVLARQEEVSTGDVRRVERTVRTEIARMERLVEDLLLLARTDEEQLVRPEKLDVNPFVTELFDGLTLTAERRFELAPLPGGTLVADADRVAQVVRNLARNAVEHARPDNGLVRLAVRPIGGGRLEFAVEDDGPGIPEEMRDRIFDRFQRTDESRVRTAGGAGLGLAFARAIVAAHGGRIAAGTSSMGGARVAFWLPGYDRPRTPRGARERATLRRGG